MKNIFSSTVKLETLFLAYIDNQGEKNKILCYSNNSLDWFIEDLNLNDIAYYGFIVNEEYWICDPNSNKYCEINGELFSKGFFEKVKNDFLNVTHTESGSDFYEKDYSIFDKKSKFTDLDKAICFRAVIEGVTKDYLIIFQIIDPEGGLFHMSSELLKKNTVDKTRIFHSAFKISKFLKKGKWSLQLVHNNRILCSHDIKYNEVSIGYSSKFNKINIQNRSIIDFEC